MYVILVGVIFLVVGGVVAYRIYHRPSSTILETRTFSCPGMNGFTFDYPVFEGFKIFKTLSTNPKDCKVFFAEPMKTKPTPGMGVEKRIVVENSMDFETPPESKKNKNDISYFMIDDDRVAFYPDRFTVWVSLSGIPKNGGFSRDAFWKEVVESFRTETTHMTKKDVPDTIKSKALEAVRRRYASIDPQMMDKPTPILENDTWTLTIVDISQRIPPSGISQFLVTVSVKTGNVSITPHSASQAPPRASNAVILNIVDEFINLPSFDQLHIEKVLGSTLSEYPNESPDQSYSITHGFTNDNFEEIELREPAGEEKRTTLILNIRSVPVITHAVTQADVIAHFGTTYESPVSPHPIDYFLTYQFSPSTIVSFGFSNVRDTPLKSITIERMN